MSRTMVAGCALIIATVWATQAAAGASRLGRSDDFSLPEEKSSRFEADTADLFGFSDGTDTNDAGEREFQGGIDTRFGKRVLNPQNDPPGKGRYRVALTSLGVQYGVTDNFSIETSFFLDSRVINHVPDVDNVSRSLFNGASVQFKYRLLERTRENRFGLSVQFEPKFFRVNDADGRRQDGFGGETTVQWDARLIDSLLWYGGNLTFGPQVGRFKNGGQFQRQSDISLSQALSVRALDNTYLGVEARYARGYDGIALKTFQGQALSIGPTFFYRFSRRLFIAAAYQVQVWGHEKGDQTHSLDINNFERHYARIKFGMNF